MNENPKLSIVADVLVGILFVILFFGGVFVLRMSVVLDTASKYQKDMTTPHGYVIGKVKTVESWKGEPVVHKDGNLTIILDERDRTKVTFEDGRSKELLGLPKEPISIGKEVAIVWAKYDIFLEAVDAEDKRLEPRSVYS
jgi:hypothetical protein